MPTHHHSLPSPAARTVRSSILSAPPCAAKARTREALAASSGNRTHVVAHPGLETGGARYSRVAMASTPS